MTSEPRPKIILIGDLGVGKTTMIMRYVDGQYLENIDPFESLNKEEIINGTPTTLLIQDTCGAERVQSITSFFYTNTTACVFVFDATEPNSLENLQAWLVELKRYAPEKGVCPKFLAMNKCDLECKCKDEDIERIKNVLGVQECYKVSNVTGDGIQTLFTAVAQAAAVEYDRLSKSKPKVANNQTARIARVQGSKNNTSQQ